jgi:hypothetical protein
MSLLLVHVSWGPLCTYPSTLCVYHPPIYKDATRIRFKYIKVTRAQALAS